jgi:PPOX class probable F420-dependent enzyme
MSTLTMSRAEREAFLADVHVAVLAVESVNGPPMATPVWYLYTPGGDVLISTDTTTIKYRLLSGAGRATLCVQRETVPYAYVSVTGSVSIEPSTEDLRLELALRYLEADLARGYVESTVGEDHVLVRLSPQRWWTTDYSKPSP